MSYTNTPSRRSPLGNFRLSLQPAPAWTAILALAIFTLLGSLAGASSIMRLAFPLGAFVVGVFLYRRYPILYLGFTWWLWFLTALVRRIIDLRGGWAEPSPVLLAPFLVTLVTVVTLLRYLPKSYRMGGLPFVLSLTGVVYAVLIGLINSRYGLDDTIINVIAADNLTYTLSNVILKALDWATPILFSFHIFANWQHYPEYRQNIQRVFRWAVLILGVYGIVQYVMPLEWDRFWLANVAGGTFSFGRPEPFGMRVFSTMHSAAPFAQLMVAGLILVLADQGILRIFGVGFGFISLLLTLVRAAWGGWVVGFLIFSSSLKAKLQMRLLVTVLVVGICAFPLTAVEPFSTVITSRVQSITTVQEDYSYQARAASYNRALGAAPFQYLGNGLGLPGLDSAFLDVILQMGWLGGIPYLGGLILILFKLSQCLRIRSDPFLIATTSICFATFGMLIFNNVFAGIQGVIFWSFIGISLAGHKYYYQQQRTASHREFLQLNPNR